MKRAKPKKITTDPRFTKLLGEHMLNAKGFYEYGLENKLIDEQQLRFTIDARKKEAIKLVESGMSRRKAAKVLGVSPSAIDRDVRQNGAKARQNGVADKPPVDEADRTNTVTRLLFEAVEKFQERFEEWLASNPPEEAKRQMSRAVTVCGDMIAACAAELPGESKEQHNGENTKNL